jgi:hypothetical protein
LADKKLPSRLTGKKRTAAVVQRARAKLPLRAHPSLVHGFLVKLPPVPVGHGRAAKRAGAKSDPVDASVQRDAGSKCEGPPRDVTFH